MGKISRNCVQLPGCFPSFAFLALNRWLAPGRHRGQGHASEVGGLGPRKELKTKTSFLGKAACRSVMTAGCTGGPRLKEPFRIEQPQHRPAEEQAGPSRTSQT